MPLDLQGSLDPNLEDTGVNQEGLSSQRPTEIIYMWLFWHISFAFLFLLMSYLQIPPPTVHRLSLKLSGCEFSLSAVLTIFINWAHQLYSFFEYQKHEKSAKEPKLPYFLPCAWHSAAESVFAGKPHRSCSIGRHSNHMTILDVPEAQKFRLFSFI